MKNIIVGVILALAASSASAANIAFGVGYGQEKINDAVTVDLYQAQGVLGFSSGMMLGASIQRGYPDNSAVPREVRTEITAGYRTRICDFFPYAVVSVGQRDRKQASKYNYHTVRIGSRYAINDRLFLDASYRFRDTNKADWKTHTYFAGAGYNVSKTTSVEFQYGKTNGSFDSDSFALFFVNRF